MKFVKKDSCFLYRDIDDYIGRINATNNPAIDRLDFACANQVLSGSHAGGFLQFAEPGMQVKPGPP